MAHLKMVLQGLKVKKLIQVTNLVRRSQSTVTLLNNDLTQNNQNTKSLAEMPSPPAWPIVGHLPIMIKKENQLRMDKLFERLREEYGDIYKMSLPGQGPLVVVFRPEDIKTLYTSDGKTPHMASFDMFEFIRKTTMKDRYTTAGLINNGEDWYEVRRQVQQDMMRPKSAFHYISDLEDIAIELTEKAHKKISKDEILDPYPLMQEYALEAVGCIFMGTRLGAIKGVGDGKRIIEILTKMFECLNTLFLFPTSIAPYLPVYKRFVKYNSETFDICKKYVDEAIAKVEDTDDTVIAKLVRKCGKDSPIPLIMGIDALQAGIDTTGTTAAFLLYHLADNPDKQELLFQEICEVIGPDGNLTESALGKMKYMKACQTESQRMLPAVFGSTRKTDSDLILGGYQIPKGTTVIRCGSSSANDPTNFPNPEKFLPERWLRGSPERHSADSFANIPFGHGARYT